MKTPRPMLQVMNTHLRDREFALSTPVTIIGRSPSCDIDLDHTSVSRKHARIEEVNGAFTVLDLGSRNGTKVNGIDLPQSQLQPGDVLFIGEVQLRFDIMVAPGEAAPPPSGALNAETMAYTPADETSARPLTSMDILAAAQRATAPSPTWQSAVPGTAAEAIEEESQTGPVVSANFKLIFAVALGLALAAGIAFLGVRLFGGESGADTSLSSKILLRVGDRKWVSYKSHQRNYGDFVDNTIHIDDPSIADVERFEREKSELVIIGKAGGATTASFTTRRGYPVRIRIIVRGRAPKPLAELSTRSILPDERRKLADAFLRNGKMLERDKPYLAMQEYNKALAVLKDSSTNKGRLYLRAKQWTRAAEQMVSERWDKLASEIRLAWQNGQWASCVDLTGKGLALIPDPTDPRHQKCASARWTAIRQMAEADTRERKKK